MLILVLLVPAPGLPLPPPRDRPPAVPSVAVITNRYSAHGAVSFNAWFLPDGSYEARPLIERYPDGDPRDYEEGHWWVDRKGRLRVCYRTHWTRGLTITSYEWNGQIWCNGSYTIRKRRAPHER